MDRQSTVLSPGTVVIRGNVIESLYAGRWAEQEEAGTSVRVIPAQGKLVLPGFVNCHTHVSEILLRGGVGSNRSLYDWQWNIVYPAIRRYETRDVFIAALLYAFDSLRAGTTTFIDNANSAFSVDLAEAALGAYRQAGVRAVLAPVFAAGPIPDAGLHELARHVQRGGPRLDPSATLVGLREAEAMLGYLMEKYNVAGNELLRVWPAPHKPNRTSAESIQLSHELAERHGGMVSQPCAEIEAEMQIGASTSVEYLFQHGALGPRTLLGHCVYVSSRDIEIIAQTDARLAHLPVANLYLGSGVAPIPRMLDARVTVGLGTDNANCNNSVSVLREMSVAALIHKGMARDPTVLTAQQTLGMATTGGARAISCDHLVGSIEAGKRADIVVLDTARTNMSPLHEPAAGIVYQATGGEIDTVIVDGKILLNNGRLTELSPEAEADLRAEAQRRSVEIIRRTGIT